MQFPLNMIFQLGDLVMLWTCYEAEHNYPLVTSFVTHDAASFHLRVVISIGYENGRLTFLSAPLPDNESGLPVEEALNIRLASASTFRYRVLVFREENHNDQWQFAHLQPTMLSPSIALTELERDLDADLRPGIFCLGPADPWSTAASANTDPAIYWLPAVVYENASSDAHKMLRAQVSNSPSWAFSTSTYTVRYLVHDLL